MNRMKLALAAALVVAPALLVARSVTIPNVFSNGSLADANAMNANFAELEAGIDDNDARLDALDTGNFHGARLGEPGAAPLLVGGSSPSAASGHAGAAMLPVQFSSTPVFAITPRIPDDGGATRCRLLVTGRSQLGWGCWTYASGTAAEMVDWLAVEAGTFSVPTQSGATATLQAGIFDSTTANCTTCTVTFPQAFAQAPVVIVSVDESYDNGGPTSAYLTTVSTTGFTVGTSHNNTMYVADRIHWIAVQPTGADPLVWGTRALYAGKATETAQTTTGSFGVTIPKTPASVVLTPQGGGATSVRHCQPNSTNTNFLRALYTDTGGATNSTVHWLAWVDR